MPGPHTNPVTESQLEEARRDLQKIHDLANDAFDKLHDPDNKKRHESLQMFHSYTNKPDVKNIIEKFQNLRKFRDEERVIARINPTDRKKLITGLAYDFAIEAYRKGLTPEEKQSPPPVEVKKHRHSR